MLRRVSILSLLALVACAGLAGGQTFNARRMGMGGVVLAGGGPGSDAANVAYRAVPAVKGAGWALPLPLGVIPLLADPPEFDSSKPEFNIYELANLLYNPPWNLQLSPPSVPGNDITIAVGRNHLAVDLGDIRSIFPRDHSRLGTVANGPALGFGFRHFFLAAAPLVHYQNDLSFNDALRRAIDGDAFQPNTAYQMLDDGHGQAAAGLHLGWAGTLTQTGDPRTTGMGLYAGARVKLMRGLAYASADNSVAFTTGDTLFATDPVDVQYRGHIYDTGPEGGRFGRGLDLGAVWMVSGIEVGLGVNDIGTQFDWRVRESLAHNDAVTGDYVQEVIARDVPLTSHVPTTATANVATRVGRVVLAGDVVRGVNATTGHVGAESWLNGFLALRAGGFVDPNRMLQYTAGTGLRFGPIGLDLAVASNSRNLSRERSLELGAGLAFYR
jgi:hypothetical protein